MRANHALSGVVLSAVLAASAVAFAAAPTFAADTIKVNITSNASDASGGSGLCDVNPALPGLQCSLRAAMQTANFDPDLDVIVFGFGGTAPKTINVPSALPRITERVVINGYSAPNTKVNGRLVGTNAKLRIVLKGPGSSATFPGLDVAARSTVKGLVIQAFDEGVFISPGGEGSTLSGNFIGTTPNGMRKAKNLRSGVHVNCDAAVNLGGSSKAARNIIAGNGQAGILLCERVDWHHHQGQPHRRRRGQQEGPRQPVRGYLGLWHREPAHRR